MNAMLAKTGFVLCASLFLLAACGPAPTATTPPPEHRIGVRVVDGLGQF